MNSFPVAGTCPAFKMAVTSKEIGSMEITDLIERNECNFNANLEMSEIHRGSKTLYRYSEPFPCLLKERDLHHKYYSPFLPLVFGLEALRF